MIIVTGGAGFIGANTIVALNARGIDDVLVVDNLARGVKFRNLVDLDIRDYIDKEAFITEVTAGGLPKGTRAVIHLGACSATTEWDGRYLMENNYRYSVTLLEACAALRIPFIYASSAAVYGMGPGFREDPVCEHPLNVYGYSKLLFDRLVRRHLRDFTSPVVGLRYFNVYGPRESHKGAMASVAAHCYRQLRETGAARLFVGTEGYADGGQERDFVHVADAVEASLWFLEHEGPSGVYNIGTGRAQTFNEVAQAAIAQHGSGRIEYIPFPDRLRGRYQNHTEADLSALRAAGCDVTFRPVERGVVDYLNWLDAHPGHMPEAQAV